MKRTKCNEIHVCVYFYRELQLNCMFNPLILLMDYILKFNFISITRSFRKHVCSKLNSIIMIASITQPMPDIALSLETSQISPFKLLHSMRINLDYLISLYNHSPPFQKHCSEPYLHSNATTFFLNLICSLSIAAILVVAPSPTYMI